ncbi:ATP-dependent DNA ligase [Paenibacillus agilis]|uniref:ATP-dependent DNA ligase n=1 Tax=Paenibacillus agilis TaxID=3020863 RepID=A0A559IEP8_9BACL|nr:ATP-dependent DNA ligase [Paenibacillus agilis]TVX85990.1 ATP-dependent DNA ligase [Paenibacillus agilis]
MQNIVDVFKRIKETSSRSGKESILKANEGNVEFRRILEFMYNPFVLTGIKAKKLQKFSDFQSNHYHIQFYNVFEAMQYIVQNNSGRDEDVKAIANFINEHEDEEHDFLQDMFTKDYKCGITSGTINKVYGKGTIHEFDVLLAKAFKDHGHKLKGIFYITLKLDGIRCVAIKKDGVVQFYTRQGQPIDDLIDIEAEIAQKLPDNFVLDGELLLENPKRLPSDELFRATQKVVRKDGIKQNLEFNVFDGLPLEEFLEGRSKLKYEARRKEIGELFNNAKPQFIRQLPVLYIGDDKAVISEILQEVVANGHEGLMINTANGHYVTKRSDVLLKVKEMHTVDLQVLELEEGSGKYKGTLGAIVVDYKGYRVGVGSGFTDTERNMLWNTKDIKELSLIGKIAEIQYFEESSNEDGGISLRFPVFKRIRDDKDEPSLH